MNSHFYPPTVKIGTNPLSYMYNNHPQVLLKGKAT
jgi:hypothetical protein